VPNEGLKHTAAVCLIARPRHTAALCLSPSLGTRQAKTKHKRPGAGSKCDHSNYQIGVNRTKSEIPSTKSGPYCKVPVKDLVRKVRFGPD